MKKKSCRFSELAGSPAMYVFLSLTLMLVVHYDTHAAEPKLPTTPYNYLSIVLPDHFQDQDVVAADTTPNNNPVTNAGATLGRVLFYDTATSYYKILRFLILL